MMMMTKRRHFIQAVLAGGLWVMLTGHSPYKQWDVFRKTRLVVLVNADDQSSVKLGTALAEFYAKQLPESRATFARAKNKHDMVRLLASKQLEVALLTESDAYAVLTGAEPYADNGKVPLRALASLGDYLFICREDLPPQSAQMLTEALGDNWGELKSDMAQKNKNPRPADGSRIPLHQGALEYYKEHG
jgi:TRAP-type uncharacterized transport system substrate-binding protein